MRLFFSILASFITLLVLNAQTGEASLTYFPTECNQKLGVYIQAELPEEIMAQEPTKIKFELFIIEGSIFTNEHPNHWNNLCEDAVGSNEEPEWILFPPPEEQWTSVKISTLDIPASGSLSKHITIDLAQRPDINTGFLSCIEIDDLFELIGVGIEINGEWVLLDSWEDCSISLSNTEIELEYLNDIERLFQTYPEEMDLVIFNAQGRQIKRLYSADELTYENLLINLESGVYIVQLNHNRQQWSQKVIVNH